MKKRGIWRHPAQESRNLYPGLVVHDSRQTGSITAGISRLPLWCFVGFMALAGWSDGEVAAFNPDRHGWTKEAMAEFLGSLLDQRGEFARLLLILADVERRESARLGRDDRAWYEVGVQRARVARQLRRCLEALENIKDVSDEPATEPA